MESNISLGRIAGIRVGAHWSVVAIWWLLAWALSTELLPEAAPGYTRATYWAVAGLAAIVLLACLLAHELSHAIVAQRHGVTTDAITLWVFGGVAQLKDETPSPRAELLIAGAGPATSLGLAAISGIGSGVLQWTGAPELLTVVVAWLAAVNLVLAVFNLLPGFPLDGGRVLHAWLWRRSGNRLQATRTAAKVGRGFGYTLIGLGLIEFTAGYFGGLWFVFIGWFLLSAATAERDQSNLRDALGGLRVADVMTPDPDPAPDWISVADLLDGYILRLRHSSFPVHDREGGLTGLVTLAGVKAVAADRRSTTPVSRVSEGLAEVTLARPDEPLVDLLDRLSTSRSRRALVLSDRSGRVDSLVGIVTPTDVARALDYSSLTGLRPAGSG